MPKTILLKPMDEALYDHYMKRHVEEYIEERMKIDKLSYTQAKSFVEQDHKRRLPQGLHTPNHHFYGLTVGENQNRIIGYLWFYTSNEAPLFQAFLYHIMIEEQERRKGYGKQSLRLLEEKVKELGCHSIWLNVFPHNESAQILYQNSGYEVGAIHMCKFFEGASLPSGSKSTGH